MVALFIVNDSSRPSETRWSRFGVYIHPRPQPERRLVEFQLPPDLSSAVAIAQVHATLLCAVAAGELAVDEAKEISAIIETHRRTIETVALVARIAQLENARSTEPNQPGGPDVQN